MIGLLVVTFLIGAGAAAITMLFVFPKGNPLKGSVAFAIPFERPMCTRCRVILKKSGVMFVEQFPSPGVLYCHDCFKKMYLHKKAGDGTLQT